MRISFGAILGVSILAISTAAQAALPKACGDESAQFKVKGENVHSLPAASSDKAQIVFLERLSNNPGNGTVRFAVDGAWVGADRGNSYFVMNVDPGVHHLCTVRQSSISMEKDFVSSPVVNLEAGKTYFFEFNIQRDVFGWAKRADGGSGGGAMGSTPNMTVKDGDSIELASFGQLNQQTGRARIQQATLSNYSPK
jgi:hypothetical protein